MADQSPLSRRSLRRYRRLLVRWRSHLAAYMEEIDAEMRVLDRPGPAFRIPWTDPSRLSGTEVRTFQKRGLLKLIDSVQYIALEIREAIRRMDSGTYGLCEIGGEPIAGERLEYRPWVRCCADHDRQARRRTNDSAPGRVGRRRAGADGAGES